jgi:hypothetical protein
MIKFNEDYIPHANRTDMSAVTEESQPSQRLLPVEKKGKS